MAFSAGIKLDNIKREARFGLEEHPCFPSWKLRPGRLAPRNGKYFKLFLHDSKSVSTLFYEEVEGDPLGGLVTAGCPKGLNSKN